MHNLHTLKQRYTEQPRDLDVIAAYTEALKKANQWPFCETQFPTEVSKFGIVAEMTIWAPACASLTGGAEKGIDCQLLDLNRKAILSVRGDQAYLFSPSPTNGFWIQRLPEKRRLRLLDCWGKPLGERDYFMVSTFEHGQALVGEGTTRVNTVFNVVDEQGELLLPDWVKEIPQRPVSRPSSNCPVIQ